jgi:hypothetical protein
VEWEKKLEKNSQTMGGCAMIDRKAQPQCDRQDILNKGKKVIVEPGSSLTMF